MHHSRTQIFHEKLVGLHWKIGKDTCNVSAHCPSTAMHLGSSNPTGLSSMEYLLLVILVEERICILFCPHRSISILEYKKLHVSIRRKRETNDCLFLRYRDYKPR